MRRIKPMERQINSPLDFSRPVPMVIIKPLASGFVIEISFPGKIKTKFANAVSNLTCYHTKRNGFGFVELINADTRVYPSLERIEAALKRAGYSEFVLIDRLGTRVGLCQGRTDGGWSNLKKTVES